MIFPPPFFLFQKVFGFVLLGLSAFLLTVSLVFYLNSEVVSGEIIELKIIQGSNMHAAETYAPKYRYTIKDKTYEKISSSNASPPKFKVRQKITVRYLASDPNNSQINEFFELFGGSIITFCMGIGMFFLRWVMMAIQIQKLKSEEQEQKQA
jgi:hypothetical protein